MNAAWSLFRREMVRWWRQPSRIAGAIGTPVLLWVLLASGLSASFAPRSGADYNAYLLPGMMSLVILFAAIFTAMSLIEDRNAGFLQAVLVSPAPRWAIVAGKTIGGGVTAWVQALPMLLAVPFVGLHLDAVGFMQILLALLLESVCVTGLCLAAAWWVNSSAGFHGIMSLFLMPMWLLSGAFFPIGEAAAWLRTLATINPLTWPPAIMQAALTGRSPDLGAWGATIVFAVVGFALATLIMGRSSK